MTLGACDDSMNDACQLLPRGVGDDGDSDQGDSWLGRQSANIYSAHRLLLNARNAMRNIRGEIRGTPAIWRGRPPPPSPVRPPDVRHNSTVTFSLSLGVTPPHSLHTKYILYGGR